MTPIAGASLADCAETYFAQSEQLPTRFALAMGEALEPGGKAHWRGGGVLLQHMPKASLTARDAATGPDGLLAAEDLLAGDDADNWRRAVMLLETVEATELIGPHVGAEQLLTRLFLEEDPRVYTAQPVRFGCTCGPEKVVRTLSIYSADDIADMTTPEGKVTADCQFCGAHYEFDPPSSAGRTARVCADRRRTSPPGPKPTSTSLLEPASPSRRQDPTKVYAAAAAALIAFTSITPIS